MIVTFYSYKGGTGRTMAMANIAGLLSSQGKRVLAVDFDLEAPGLWRYFSRFHKELQQQEGLIDLLLAASVSEDPASVDWREYVTEVSLYGTSLSLMTSGQAGNQYPSRVLNFDWTTFFRDFKGGEFIESMRAQWRQEYDFTLIDSRTGITDSLGYALNTISQLIESELRNAKSIIGGTDAAANFESSGSEYSAQRPARKAARIALWGAPQSGKTTFLAAIYVAINRSLLDLNIFGANDESTEFMVQNTHALTAEHRFPEGTQAASSYSWTMNMATQVQVPARARFGKQNATTANVPVQFRIDLLDTPGGFYAIHPALPPSRLDIDDGNSAAGHGSNAAPSREEMIDYLADCEGLLLLIDPIREQEQGDANEYLQGTLLRIAQRRLASMPPGSRLPHYVAVCITKFDDPRVYNFARLNGYDTYNEDDPYMFPRVHDAEAKAFFQELCRSSEVSDAGFVVNALSKYFRPERIRYFVTSAIGFYRQSGKFRKDDPQNVEESGGTFRIRGQIHPINVLEPMLWLGQSVTTVR